MKRSEINATIKKMEALLDECRFKLPPYLYFTPEVIKKDSIVTYKNTRYRGYVYINPSDEGFQDFLF